MTRLWGWLFRRGAKMPEKDKAVFDQEHAEKMREAAQLLERQRQTARRWRALGIEVDVIQHNRGEHGK